MFNELQEIFARPEPFQFYTAKALWTDEHTSRQMLAYHLDESLDIASRNRSFIERSAAWIAARFDLGAHTRVADFGCGPGLYTTRFAQTQAAVTGIDFSEHSLHHARQTATRNGLEIDYVCHDYLVYETDQTFDLITMIMCDYCALSSAQRHRLLARFAQLLADGGSILLDVYSLKAFEQRKEASSCEHMQMDGFWSAEDYYGFVNTFKYDREKVILDKYTIIESTRRRTIYNWLQFFSPESLQEELERNGFVVDEYHADVAGTSYDSQAPEFAIIAQLAP